MSRTRLLAGLAAGLLVGFFAWEWYLSPEARVRRFLEGLAAAAEAKDKETLLAGIDPELEGYRGLGARDLPELLDRAFSRVDRLNVTLDAVRARVEGDRATATFDLTVVAVRGDERYLVVGAPMRPEKLRAELVRTSEGWRVVAVHPASQPPIS